MKRFLFSVLIIVFYSGTASAGGFLEITPDHSLKFPDDFYYRERYRLQWWYFTGHLFDREGREFGYELTFFVAGVQRRSYKSKFGVDNIYISHFAITDISGKKFYASDKSDTGAYGFAGAERKSLRVWVDNNALEGTIKKMHLTAFGPDTALDLELSPVKPVVLNDDSGYSRKSEESPQIASWYFSYTDLETEGSLRVGKETFRLNGKSWFDREISSGIMGKDEKGWDWFGIQLDDGREIMLYVIRKSDGSVDRYSSGTFVYRDGRSKHLALTDFTITVLDHYKSARTGTRYPAEWEIRIPGEGLDLKIKPLLEDQEFVATHSTGNSYWEGTCKVEGPATGRAYVEMTGY
jgi:predicted secreted hydrolase